MTRRLKTSGAPTEARFNMTRLLGAFLLWLGMAAAAIAQPWSGHKEYPTFGGPGNSIWDVSGSYTLTETITIRGFAHEASINVDLTQDAQGKLHGRGALTDRKRTRLNSSH